VRLILEAVEAVQRNVVPLILYMGAVIALVEGRYVFEIYYLHAPESISPGSPLVFYILLMDFGFTAFIALVEAVVFARLAKDIDRPLWKVEGDGDAIRRFYGLWFALGLIGMLTARLSGGILLPVIIVYSVLTPFGACVVFHGRLKGNEIGPMLEPLAAEFPNTMLVLLLNFAQLALVIALALQIPKDTLAWTWQVPLVHGVAAYFNCVVFAATFMICKTHRDTFEDVDIDF
jgi:uncharacterized membrane protein